MKAIYFFDLPVYRLSENDYDQQRDKWINDFFIKNPSLRKDDIFMQNHNLQLYGGCWEFNEIMGYIKLYFSGYQVLGEYYSVNKKRIVRTRTKILQYQTHKLAPEVNIPYPITQSVILNAIREYICDCKKELPNRYINDSMFEVLAENINWVAILQSQAR